MSTPTPEIQGPQGPKGDPGDKGDKGDQGESKLVPLAATMVASLVKARERQRWFNAILAFAVVIALGAGTTAGVGVIQERQQADRQQAASLASCVAGNTARATNKRIWDEFLTILIDNPQTAKTRSALEAQIAALGLPSDVQQGLDAIVIANWSDNPGNVTIADQFEAYIAVHEKAQDCAQLYG